MFSNDFGFLSFNQEDNDSKINVLENLPSPLFDNAFSTINEITSMNKLNNFLNVYIHDRVGQTDTKENTYDLPTFYSIDDILDKYILDFELRKKLDNGKSIIDLIQYRFMKLGVKKGLKNNLSIKINTNEEKHKKRGRKEKRQKIFITHDKMSPDNIIKKIKSSLFNKYILNFLNLIIKQKFKDKYLVKLAHKYINEFTKEKELNYLKMRLKDLYSLDITKKNISLDSDYNKKVINEIINKDDTIRFVFDLTLDDFIKLFIGKKQVEGISHFINYEEIKKSLPTIEEFCWEIVKKNDINYSALVIFYLFNYERALKLKQNRKKKI